MRVGSKGCEQGFIGKNIDAPRQPLGDIVNKLGGRRAEDVRTFVARGTHAELQIFGDVVSHQRFEREIMGDSFLQLTHVGARQYLVQLGLAEEHQLQQFVAIRFEIGQEPNVFQRFRRHGMGFIDEDDDSFSFRVKPDQVILQYL